MSELGVILLLFFFTLFALSVFVINLQQRDFNKQRAEWQTERKDLLDRIQAPSFQEYTNKVIREKKLEKPEEQEEPIHFVS